MKFQILILVAFALVAPAAASGLCDFCKIFPTGVVCAANEPVNPFRETLLNACWVKCNKLGSIVHKGECCTDGQVWCGSLNKCVGVDEDCCQADADCGSSAKCCAGRIAPDDIKGTTKRGRFASTCESTCDEADCLINGGCKCTVDRDCGKSQHCCKGKCQLDTTDCCAKDSDCGFGSKCCDDHTITDLFSPGVTTRIPRKCRPACVKPMSLVSGQDRCVDSEQCGDAEWDCARCQGHDLSVHCCEHRPQRFTLNNLV